MSTTRFNCSVGGAPPRVLEPVDGGLRSDEVRRTGVLREHTLDGLPQLLRPADIGSMAEAQRTYTDAAREAANEHGDALVHEHAEMQVKRESL